MPHRRTVYLVELFSGSSSVAKAIARALPADWALEVHSVDIHPHYNPTTRTDILTWDYEPVLERFLAPATKQDLIWVHASPPCTEYSKAKTTGERDLPLADKLVKRALHIIKFCKSLAPDRKRFFWTLENPVGLLRTRAFMKGLNESRLHTTSYCKWGKPFRKDTDIWTNVPDPKLPVCRQGSYCKQKELLGRHGVTAQAGPSASSVGSGSGENVYPLPSKLVAHLFSTALASLETHAPKKSSARRGSLKRRSLRRGS
jgi:hypothetical protein